MYVYGAESSDESDTDDAVDLFFSDGSGDEEYVEYRQRAQAAITNALQAIGRDPQQTQRVNGEATIAIGRALEHVLANWDLEYQQGDDNSWEDTSEPAEYAELQDEEDDNDSSP